MGVPCARVDERPCDEEKTAEGAKEEGASAGRESRARPGSPASERGWSAQLAWASAARGHSPATTVPPSSSGTSCALGSPFSPSNELCGKVMALL